MECGATQRVKMGCLNESCASWRFFTLKDSDNIQEVSIGDGCFVCCEKTVFESECEMET